MEGSEPGYMTDTMNWRDCQIREDLEEIMNKRVGSTWKNKIEA